MGIALAAVRLSSLLGEEKWLEYARQLLRRAIFENPGEPEFDLLSGVAGAIVASIVLRDILADMPLLDFAVQLGDQLLHLAEKSKVGYSWKSIANTHHRHLTGFSHGTAGVGFALLELFQATGDIRYREAATQAFQYERYWFDVEANNWPNFHKGSGQSKRSKLPLSFSTHWCHGAPGIALSRLRAYQILNDKTCKDEAVTALRTTRQMIETWLRSSSGNYSLCHGLAGNAEILLYGYQVLGQEEVNDSMLAYEVANAGVELYGKQEVSWPCGVGGGETPGLMLGLAGIGYFYLRLHNSRVPSILILQRENLNLDNDTPKNS